MDQHLLSIVLWTPIAGLLVLLFLPSKNKSAIRIWANVTACAGFLVSLPLVFRFESEAPGYQYVEHADWIPSLGASYSIGIDGISLLLLMLTTLMGFLAILSSWKVQDRVKEYYAMFLLLQTGMIGVFISLDFFLFYIFWELVLVPMYFIIGVWGGPRKLYAAIKFFLYTLAGSVLMLLGILTLYFQHFNQFGFYTFEISELMKLHLPLGIQQWVFWAFFLGFAIKVPMFPFHTWLPDAHVEAPTAGSVILASVLLKMGTYGFLRFSLPLLPQASMDRTIVQILAVLSIVGIVYGALVSLMQQDWKKLVAYSSVSHLGFCTLGIFAMNPNGIAGSVLQQVNHGISTGMLFLIIGMIYERRHTREIAEYGGLAHVMPKFAVIFAIAMLSSAGLPLLNGFIGEFTILQGAFEANRAWAAFAVTGVIFGAAYLLWLYQRTMLGEVTNTKNLGLSDLSFREVAIFVPLILWAVWIGVYPKPYFDVLRKPVTEIVERVRPGYFSPRSLTVAAQKRGTVAQRDAGAQRDAAMQRDTAVPRDTAMPRDTIAQRHAAVQRDAAMPRDSIAQHDAVAQRHAAVPRDTVAQRDAAVPRDTGAQRDSTMPRDAAMPRDTAGQRDTAVPRDTAMPRDTIAQRDTVAQRDTIAQRDTVAQRDAPVQRHAAAQRDAPVQRHAAAQRDSIAQRDAAVPRDSTMPRDAAMPRDTAGQRDAAMQRDTAVPRDTAMPRDTVAPRDSIAQRVATLPSRDRKGAGAGGAQ